MRLLYKIQKRSMNWEQTIKYIRTIPDFKDLVEKAYLDEDIQLNVDRFSNSDEFKETLLILKKNGLADNMNLLDLGAGNGIAAVSFASRDIMLRRLNLILVIVWGMVQFRY